MPPRDVALELVSITDLLVDMWDIIKEVDSLIAEMNTLEKFNDDLFIEYFEKEEKMQERLDALVKANEISSEVCKDCSDRLAEAFGKLKGKLSFCTLS